MAVDLLPDGPNPATDPPALFSQKAAASVLAQQRMVMQINEALGQFNATQAGGAYALSYVFDAATADADPGAGKLRLSSATQNASTTMRLDVVSGATDVSSILDLFDASTSAVKGSIRLVKLGDPMKWLTFDVTARAAPSGYRNLTVVNTGGSSASPFAASDGILLFFQRNGDKGTTGDLLSPIIHVRETYPALGSGVSGLAGTTARALNNVVTNTIAGAQLASGKVTLPAGTYDFEGMAVAGGTNLAHKTTLLNSTDGVTLFEGPDVAAGSSTTSSPAISTVRGRLQISSAKTFGLNTLATGSWSTYTGLNLGTFLVPAELIFRKIA